MNQEKETSELTKQERLLFREVKRRIRVYEEHK